MKNSIALKALIIGTTLTVSCGTHPTAREPRENGNSILASIGGIETKPEGVGELSFELRCDAAMTDLHETPILGTLTTSNTDAVIEFKRTAERPLLPGTSCKLTVVGPTNLAKFDYLDKPIDSAGKTSIYHMTSIGKIAANNTLKLISVKRYNEKGLPLFKVAVSIANSDIVLARNAKAQLACTESEPIAANMGVDQGKFEFLFTAGQFAAAEKISCNEFVVTSGDKTYLNNGPLDLKDLTRLTPSKVITVTLEEKATPARPASAISVEIVNSLNNSFDGVCEKISAQAPASDTSKLETWDLAISAGANTGKATRSVKHFSDPECKILSTTELPVSTVYDLEILSPTLVTMTNTLPVAFYTTNTSTKALETNTIINLTDNKLRFGSAVQGETVWSGSKDLAKLPITLSTVEFLMRSPGQR